MVSESNNFPLRCDPEMSASFRSPRSRSALSSSSRESGATLVEASIAIGLLLTVIFGIAEFGLAFKDWLSVSHAAREGARTAAVFADSIYADIETLRMVDKDLRVASTEINWIRIFNPATGTGTTYAPAGTICGWNPCPDPDNPADYTVPTWNPLDRDITAPMTDRVGIQVDYDHEWVTGLFGSSTNHQLTVTFQIEPQVFE
jgi:hypothetical protein